jgi:hypothetical protein
VVAVIDDRDPGAVTADRLLVGVREVGRRRFDPLRTPLPQPGEELRQSLARVPGSEPDHPARLEVTDHRAEAAAAAPQLLVDPDPAQVLWGLERLERGRRDALEQPPRRVPGDRCNRGRRGDRHRQAKPCHLIGEAGVGAQKAESLDPHAADRAGDAHDRSVGRCAARSRRDRARCAACDRGSRSAGRVARSPSRPAVGACGRGARPTAGPPSVLQSITLKPGVSSSLATSAWVATFSSSHCMNKRNRRSGWPTPARVQSAAIGPFVGARGT